MMDLKLKKFLVDNQELIQGQLVSIAASTAATAIGAAFKIVFDLHDAKRMVILEDDPETDFVVMEEAGWDNEIRDFIHDPEHRKKILESYGVKNGKKKEKKKKENNEKGGAIAWE